MDNAKWWALYIQQGQDEYAVVPVETQIVTSLNFIKNFQIAAPYFLNAVGYKHVYSALRALGYTDPDPTITHIAQGRYSVTLGDKYFGVYDTDKKTFVD